jgi:hypothetical protein
MSTCNTSITKHFSKIKIRASSLRDSRDAAYQSLLRDEARMLIFDDLTEEHFKIKRPVTGSHTTILVHTDFGVFRFL